MIVFNKEKLKELMKDEPITAHKLTQLTGLSYGHIPRLVDGKYKNPRIEVVYRISRHFNINMEELCKNNNDN